MAAALGDFIRITDRQELLAQQVLNVFFYRVTNITGIAGDYLTLIGEWYRDTVMVDALPLQHADLIHNELFLENISNGVDIATVTDGFPLNGEVVTGEVMPPFVSWGFQLVRESRVTRNGYKRLGGVPEVNVNAGVATGNSSEIANYEAALGLDIVLGLVTAAEPVIIKRPFVVPLVDPEYASISTGLYKGVGSQNTRKFGRGV